MKLSELIERAEELLADYGDGNIDMYVELESGQYCDLLGELCVSRNSDQVPTYHLLNENFK